MKFYFKKNLPVNLEYQIADTAIGKGRHLIQWNYGLLGECKLTLKLQQMTTLPHEVSDLKKKNRISCKLYTVKTSQAVSGDMQGLVYGNIQFPIYTNEFLVFFILSR